jgi:hypothetical protein
MRARMSFRERLRRSPFATRRLSLNRCWVQRRHRYCTRAGNEDSTEENAIGLRFSGRVWYSDASASGDDWTEKICALDSGRPDSC